MRLALAMGRTVEELRETMNADEWSRWLLFHELYDLPDGFLVAGQLGTVVSQAIGGKGKPENFAPYYKIDGAEKLPAQRQQPSLRPYYDFLKGYAADRKRAGNPLPTNR